MCCVGACPHKHGAPLSPAGMLSLNRARESSLAAATAGGTTCTHSASCRSSCGTCDKRHLVTIAVEQHLVCPSETLRLLVADDV